MSTYHELKSLARACGVQLHPDAPCWTPGTMVRAARAIARAAQYLSEGGFLTSHVWAVEEAALREVGPETPRQVRGEVWRWDEELFRELLRTHRETAT